MPDANFSYTDQLMGHCNGIPSGVHLSVLYTEAGLSNWRPIYRIIGAQVRFVLSILGNRFILSAAICFISYTLSNWKMQCAEAKKCSENETSLFEVTSSVSFTRVPLHIPPPLTK
jgi:hypothetical protein